LYGHTWHSLTLVNLRAVINFFRDKQKFNARVHLIPVQEETNWLSYRFKK